MSDKDDKNDQDWIDLLAGQSVPDADPKTVREAQILRAALLSHADKPQNESDIPYPHILENVLARLETEKLKKPSKSKFSWLTKGRLFLTSIFSKPKSPKYHQPGSLAIAWHHKPIYAFAVSLIIGVLVLFVYKISPETVPTIPTDFEAKGDKPCVNELSKQQPQLVATQMAKELEALGLDVELSAIENGWRVETVLPATQATNWEKFVSFVLNKPTIEDFLKRYEADDLTILPKTHYLCVDIISNQPE